MHLDNENTKVVPYSRKNVKSFKNSTYNITKGVDKVKDILDINIFKLTQLELQLYICDVLDEDKIKYTMIDGNIYSINHFDSPLFMAHLDTVRDLDMKKQLIHDTVSNTIYRDGAILGADDRAGIAMIMKHRKDVNFLFCRDEEVGALGAQSISKNSDFKARLDMFNVPCGIELDRKGLTDIIGSYNDYCCEDLDNKIEEVLKDLGYKTTMGVFTDCDYLNKLIPCVNLSVGYYSQHTNAEYLDLNHWKELSKRIPLLNGIRGKFKLPDLTKNRYAAWYDDDMYFGERYGYSTTALTGKYKKSEKLSPDEIDYFQFECDCCKKEYGRYVSSLSKFVCKDCAEEIIGELLDTFDVVF